MEGRKMKKKGIALLLVIGGVIAVFFCMLTLYNEGGTKMISSAKELKINASEIGMGGLVPYVKERLKEKKK